MLTLIWIDVKLKGLHHAFYHTCFLDSTILGKAWATHGIQHILHPWKSIPNRLLKDYCHLGHIPALRKFSGSYYFYFTSYSRMVNWSSVHVQLTKWDQLSLASAMGPAAVELLAAGLEGYVSQAERVEELFGKIWPPPNVWGVPINLQCKSCRRWINNGTSSAFFFSSFFPNFPLTFLEFSVYLWQYEPNEKRACKLNCLYRKLRRTICSELECGASVSENVSQTKPARGGYKAESNTVSPKI